MGHESMQARSRVVVSPRRGLLSSQQQLSLGEAKVDPENHIFQDCLSPYALIVFSRFLCLLFLAFTVTQGFGSLLLFGAWWFDLVMTGKFLPESCLSAPVVSR